MQQAKKKQMDKSETGRFINPINQSNKQTNKKTKKLTNVTNRQ